MAHCITSRQRKQKGRPHQAFLSVLSLNILYSPNLSYTSLPMLPHSGQSSQLLSDVNYRNAHILQEVARSSLVLLVESTSQFVKDCHQL